MIIATSSRDVFIVLSIDETWITLEPFSHLIIFFSRSSEGMEKIQDNPQKWWCKRFWSPHINQVWRCVLKLKNACNEILLYNVTFKKLICIVNNFVASCSLNNCFNAPGMRSYKSFTIFTCTRYYILWLSSNSRLYGFFWFYSLFLSTFEPWFKSEL